MEPDEAVEVNWGTQTIFFIHDKHPSSRADLLLAWTEDQSRINTFSKLNTRLSEVDLEITRKQVRHPFFSYARHRLSSSRFLFKEAKEALDDLALELELADEDEPVLYVSIYLSRLLHLLTGLNDRPFGCAFGSSNLGTNSVIPSFTCHYLKPWKH